MPLLPFSPRRRLWPTLAAFYLLLGAAAPAAANVVITGLDFDYIVGGYALEQEVTIFLEPHSYPGSAYQCRWTRQGDPPFTSMGRGISATAMKCFLPTPHPSTYGEYQIEATSIGTTFSPPFFPFTIDCEENRFGPLCAICTCSSQETGLGYCDDLMAGDGTCTQCVDAAPYQCGADCKTFCPSIRCDPDLCDQSTCTCLACDVGFFSATCNQACPTGCAGEGNPCDMITGHCAACDPGLYGEQCTLTAPPVPALRGRGMVLLCAGLALAFLWSVRSYFRRSESGGV
jgi:hypothetical protein